MWKYLSAQVYLLLLAAFVVLLSSIISGCAVNGIEVSSIGMKNTGQIQDFTTDERTEVIEDKGKEGKEAGNSSKYPLNREWPAKYHKWHRYGFANCKIDKEGWTHCEYMLCGTIAGDVGGQSYDLIGKFINKTKKTTNKYYTMTCASTENSDQSVIIGRLNYNPLN